MSRQIRCAIYTRKSSEEGLEQSFNSLDAQREACEAFIRSQAGEGWRALPSQYDDGGFSGGSMDRPGLTRLLADIAARRVDVVVVYKVDRLTRSLTDFARIVDVLDSAGASFVSVTQAFNTTTSMGRLTLNVLLSFAQFEREITGERIRDKIAASKAKGLWMGGMVPLGYDLVDRRLVVNEAEAGLIRRIFTRYLELGSVNQLRDELEAEEVRSKRWTTRSGKTIGGAIFNRGGVFHVLRNRLYIGEISHRGAHYPGLHPALIERELFDAVQARLDQGASVRRQGGERVASAVLKGRIFDATGEAMSPSFSYGKQGRAYRYYISGSQVVGRKASDDGVIRRVNAAAVERFVAERLSLLAAREVTMEDLRQLVGRVELRRDETHLLVAGPGLLPDRHTATLFTEIERRLGKGEVAAWEDEAGGVIRIILPVRLKLRGGRAWFDGDAVRPACNKGLVDALRLSHAELVSLEASPITSALDFSNAKAPATWHRRQLAKLVFLAPDLQRQILRGEQPKSLNLRILLKSNLSDVWEDQRAWFRRLA